MARQVEINCPVCNNNFTTKASRLADGRGKHCSKTCANITKKSYPIWCKGLKIGDPWNKGISWSEETREKMRQAKLGRKLSPEHVENIRKANTGKKRSPEIRAKLSLAMKGVPKLNARGEKHHHWRGGLTDKNQLIRHSLEYTHWRTSVFKRDDYTCIKCGSHGVYLHADHIKLFALFPELRFEVSNGQTLCAPCHKIKTSLDMKTHWKNQYTVGTVS